jgi:hypothetical protein
MAAVIIIAVWHARLTTGYGFLKAGIYIIFCNVYIVLTLSKNMT